MSLRVPLDLEWAGRHACLGLAALVVFGCSKSGTEPTDPAETSGQIIYSKFRDTSGQVSPVLSEGAGFDGGEVDSPAMAVDGGRGTGDKFMLYYEADDGSGRSTIGLVTSSEEDLTIRTIDRIQVIGLGPGGSPYASSATDPTVVVDKRPAQASARYKMWFEGRGGAGGAVSTILYTTSTDGVSWTTPVACAGLSPSFGQVRVADPSVALEDSVFLMWFEAIHSTTGSTDGPGVVGYARSVDGLNWTLSDGTGHTGAAAAPVFVAGAAGGFDGYSVNAPSVVIDFLASPGSPGRYKMWYEAGDKAGDMQSTIGYATSVNGLTWTRASLPVLVPSSDNHVPLPFDSGDLEHPAAFLQESMAPTLEGHFLLWYTGDGEAGASPNRIGLAAGRLPG